MHGQEAPRTVPYPTVFETVKLKLKPTFLKLMQKNKFFESFEYEKKEITKIVTLKLDIPVSNNINACGKQ